MCKKLLLVLTAAALLLSMTACSGIRERIDGAATEPSEEKPVISEQSDSASASEPESEATEPAPAVDYDAQLAVLAANYALWVKNGEYDPYSYSVTDLDQNGRLEVTATEKDGVLCIRIADNGAGLPPELLGKYRPDASTAGHLGLFNVDTILQKHYGAGFGLYLENRTDGTGAVITATLPVTRREDSGHAEGLGR